MLTSTVLNAAAKHDWPTVFHYLQFRDAVDIHARHTAHPEGFRLMDYAEQDNPALALQLWQLGAKPSYDIKIFRYAAQEDWTNVFHLLNLNVIDVNQSNEWHAEYWTLLDYAINQRAHGAIKALRERGAKAILPVRFNPQNYHSRLVYPIPIKPTTMTMTHLYQNQYPKNSSAGPLKEINNCTTANPNKRKFPI